MSTIQVVPIVNLRRVWLTQRKKQMEPLTFSSSSTEVTKACQEWYKEIARDNPRASSSQIWDLINPKKAEIASQLSISKKKSCKSQLTTIFSNHNGRHTTESKSFFTLFNINILMKVM